MKSKAASIFSSGTFHATSAPSAKFVASNVCRTRRIVPARNIAAIRAITTSTATPTRSAISSKWFTHEPFNFVLRDGENLFVDRIVVLDWEHAA